MSLARRLLSLTRVKKARRQLADDPSISNYIALATEHARRDEMIDATRVCDEGLSVYAGNSELQRLANRVRQLALEDRTRQLSRELRQAPRPALYKELAEVLMDCGRLERAEECAGEWFKATQDGEAQLLCARARLERFYTDRRREDGRVAVELLDSAEQLLPRDPHPLELRLGLVLRLGVYDEARMLVSRLLEMQPGDPMLEGRFRALSSMHAVHPDIGHALREVERTGALVDDQAERVAAPNSSSIRPRLKELLGHSGVQAVVFERGSTALVQGPKGPTAERTARCVRDVVQQSRTTARRLGLGQVFEIEAEGSFGCLLAVPDDIGSASMWFEGAVSDWHRRSLHELMGAGIQAPEASE